MNLAALEAAMRVVKKQGETIQALKEALQEIMECSGGMLSIEQRIAEAALVKEKP